MSLQIPPNTTTYEFSNSIIWLDNEGVMYSVPKGDHPVELSREETVREIDRLLEITGGKKVCLIIESQKNAKPPKKEDRDFIDAQLHRVALAIAIIGTSAVSRMIANLFFAFKPPKYPVKMFNDVQEARIWIRECLAQRIA